MTDEEFACNELATYLHRARVSKIPLADVEKTTALWESIITKIRRHDVAYAGAWPKELTVEDCIEIVHSEYYKTDPNASARVAVVRSTFVKYCFDALKKAGVSFIKRGLTQ